MDEEEERAGEGCAPVDHTRREEITAAREEPTTVAVAVPEGDDPRKYPRYIFRPTGSQLRLFSPGMRNPNRAPAFDAAHWEEYLAAYGRPMLTNISQLDGLPEATEEGATLPSRAQICEDLVVPCCRLEPGEAGGPGRLVFDPDSRYTWTTYQLKDALAHAQPGWRGFIERTLMFFPIEHLEASQARGILFDFRAGNPRLGARATVGDGGTNDHTRGLLIIAFAALNRWRRGGRYPGSEADIDAYYTLDAYASDSSRVVGTFYHELGHFLRLPSGRIDREHDPRFRRFFCGLVANGYGGHSLGYSEAFSEAYRYRLMGESCPPNPYTAAVRTAQIAQWTAARDAETHTGTRAQLDRLLNRFTETLPFDGALAPGEEMDAALDEMGMPTVESVREARGAILAHLRAGAG